ncbi:MAG TPA: aldo/keto reductase [Steroidobacteraceae bacterium]|nr:aldo/keto reductase [Steroidobacteraceae bacterium]
MNYIRFGRTGLQVSQLCLGTMSMGSSAWKGWVLDERDSIPILRRAVDAGINFFDMADWYSTGRNEEVVGQNLLKMTTRDRLVLATKVFYPMSDDPNDRGLSRKHIATSIDRSLARMGTDYVDLYVIHAFDADTPVEETMEALNDTVRAGKVRYLGASTMYAWQFAKMNHVAAMNGWTQFVNMQCQYNVLYREEEREMLPYCRDAGVAVTTFSPLARGFLAREAVSTARTAHDAFQDFYGDDIDREIARRVREVAARRGVSAAHVGMAWVAGNSNHNIPIVGAAKTTHLDVAVEALEVRLDAEERSYLEAPYRPRDEINDQNPVRRSRALNPG